MKSLLSIIWESKKLLDTDFCNKTERFWCEAHLSKIANNLEKFAQTQALQQPPPTLTVECTPPLNEVYQHFEKFLQMWQSDSNNSELATAFAQSIQQAGIFHMLVLLGQRITPASITDERAIPQTKEHLMKSAMSIYKAGISNCARALTKHVNRYTGEFWGEISGSEKDKNAKAEKIVLGILENTTWWNVFGHYKHEIVYEARVESGHGVRWGCDGEDFIGFLEPFTPGFPEVRDFEPTNE